MTERLRFCVQQTANLLREHMPQTSHSSSPPAPRTVGSFALGLSPPVGQRRTPQECHRQIKKRRGSLSRHPGIPRNRPTSGHSRHPLQARSPLSGPAGSGQDAHAAHDARTPRRMDAHPCRHRDQRRPPRPHHHLRQADPRRARRRSPHRMDSPAPRAITKSSLLPTLPSLI